MSAISHRYRALAVSVSADQLRNIADGRGFGLDPPALRGQGGAFRLGGGQESTGFMVSLVHEARTGLALPFSMAARAVVVRPRLAASSMAVSI